TGTISGAPVGSVSAAGAGRCCRENQTTKEMTMASLEDKLVEYIDDAYAMEQNVLRMLDGMIGTTKDAQMKRSLERHKKQTEQQAERLEDCLQEHGSSP